jgi:cell division protein FtsN
MDMTRQTDTEAPVNWPFLALGLSVLGIGCLLIGTYVLGPMVRQRLQPAAAPAIAQTAAAPTGPPQLAAIPPGQQTVKVTERPPSVVVKPAPTPPPNTITPAIAPAPETPPPPAGTAVAPAPAADPTPSPEASAPAATPAPDAAAADTAPQPITLAPPPPASMRSTASASAEPAPRYYRVQVGRFSSRGDADTLKAELTNEGYSPTVVTVKRDGREEYRVQVNTFRLRENAAKTMDELKQKQYAPYLAEDAP